MYLHNLSYSVFKHDLFRSENIHRKQGETKWTNTTNAVMVPVVTALQGLLNLCQELLYTFVFFTEDSFFDKLRVNFLCHILISSLDSNYVQ